MEIVDTWGESLRKIRNSRGLSLEELAHRTGYSKSYIGAVETHRKRPGREFVSCCDAALGCSPLLMTRWGVITGQTMEEDSVERRALGGLVAGVAAGSGLISGLASMVRHDIWRTLVPDNAPIEEVVAAYARQFVADQSPQYGVSLLAETNVVLQRVKEMPASAKERPSLLWGASRLGLLYGLYRGNNLDFAGAAGWYDTAGMLAKESGDPAGEAYIYARVANRALFEGASYKSVTDGIQHSLSLAGTGVTPARVEAYATQVCVSALIGDGRGGRAALRRVQEGAHAADGAEVANLPERAVFHRAYLESRVGTEREAYQACDDAIAVLAGLPHWLTEAKLYRARAMAAHGDVRGGLAFAAAAVQDGPAPIGVVQVAIRDFCQAVPRAQQKTDEMDVLRPLASARPGPWETA